MYLIILNTCSVTVIIVVITVIWVIYISITVHLLNVCFVNVILNILIEVNMWYLLFLSL
jgi:hypothetical protein